MTPDQALEIADRIVATTDGTSTDLTMHGDDVIAVLSAELRRLRGVVDSHANLLGQRYAPALCHAGRMSNALDIIARAMRNGDPRELGTGHTQLLDAKHRYDREIENLGATATPPKRSAP